MLAKLQAWFYGASKLTVTKLKRSYGMFKVTAKKKFLSGNLKGLNVPYSCTYPLRAQAEEAHEMLLISGTDISGRRVKYHSFKIEMVLS